MFKSIELKKHHKLNVSFAFDIRLSYIEKCSNSFTVNCHILPEDFSSNFVIIM